ncbi:MAG: DNA-binding transcriptional regulator [Massilibacteroides sp.]|nr:DNA-binding transcriptional regulator [Massilibacteroides sp.]MDD3061301.1 DNA-binding transcriptional regulator [Massilibacteroides sp.]MDD4116380.1 DNA-binding transcriptional regulator [Massilibacteroides sp.]MDD4659798.1 DNA-binding transcriptional regulator [Massilibacteroides sp.]
MAKILLLTDYSSGYSRDLLRGLVRYSKEVGSWSLQRMPLYYSLMHGERGVLEYAKRWKADAIVAKLSEVNIDLLKELNIPVVVQNYESRHQNVSNLTGDYFNTGAMAAKFFLNRGYHNFAFYGFKDAIWSRERLDGYKQEIEKHRNHLYTLENNKNKEEWSYNHTILGNWLMELPKPIALFACDDYYALQVSETCNLYNIAIPDDIAILGVDNDELLCNLSDPSLSSIVLDVENGGYRVGKLLHQLIDKKIMTPSNIVIDPLRIECRGSTEKYLITDKYIQQVIQYIEKNYANAISVKDILKEVPLSRRVLEKKFKEEANITIYQYIQNCRIDCFSRLLMTSESSLLDAAYLSGFDNYKNVSRVFKKYKKLSPVEYRKKYKSK